MCCDSCEHHVEVTNDVQQTLRQNLSFEKTKSGPPKGRVVQNDLVALGLRKGDRLEPSAAVSDVGQFESLPTPFRATFWRASSETLTRRRNPLFDAGTGLTSECLGIDVLHCLSLGVYQLFLMALFWDLIAFNAWDVKGAMSTRAELSVMRMREMLFAWYGTEERAGRAQPRVNQFQPGTLGTFSDRKFRVYAAATNGLLYFAVMLLERFGHRLGTKLGPYQRGLQCLVRIEESIKAHPRRYPPAAVQAFVEDVGGLYAAMGSLLMPWKPKHHMVGELAARLSGGINGYQLLVPVKRRARPCVCSCEKKKPGCCTAAARNGRPVGQTKEPIWS
jgi:hypothetical protein